MQSKYRNSNILALSLLIIGILSAPILQPTQLKNDMFTLQITGDFQPLLPTKLGISSFWPYPVQIYQIAAMRAKHQFLPERYAPTEIFAYAGKVDGEFVPSFPGPYLLGFKNMPMYVIYSNQIEGKHLFQIDVTPPLNMVSKFLNQVPTVPHAHGLETQMGSDGQPNGYWTKSGKRGPDYFSLNSRYKRKNEAIFRYHNTKQGLLWYHDHVMGMTRLNVYAGLVGFYQIIDPQLSIEQNNILKFYGDIQRKYFAIVDKTFKTDGSLFYSNSTQSQGFTTWIPQFFGKTIIVNGKIWPVVNLQPKKYRFVFLNGCQSRFLNIYFQHNGTKLNFQLFRRDSDFLRAPVPMKEHLFLTGARIQLFIDFTGLTGQVIMRNNAVAPYPMGQLNQFASYIMKIQLRKKPAATKNRARAAEIQPTQTGSTFISSIKSRMNYYSDNQNIFETQGDTLDFLDQPQVGNAKFNTDNGKVRSASITSQQATNEKVISINDFLDSNDPESSETIQLIKNQSNYVRKSRQQPDKNMVLDKVNNQAQNLQKWFKRRANPAYNSGYLSKAKSQRLSISILNVPYPKFPPGKPYFTILNQVKGSNDAPVSVKIDNIGLQMKCAGSFFRQGQTYDFFIINLTMDDHPIHTHIVNYQVIGRFKFDVQRYMQDWKKKNGQFSVEGLKRPPVQLDVRPYKTSDIMPPLQEQKLFTDVIRVPTGLVTIARIKFANHYGRSFPFNIKAGRYVWHCHILEHEDNQMMRYFCIE